VGIVVLALVAVAYLKFGTRKANLSLQDFEIARLTQSGKASGVAISPDGQYVVYVLLEGEKQSLMVRQVATGSDVPVIPPDVVAFYGLSFSPDGQYIYFTGSGKENPNFSQLYKIPVLGGTPVEIIRDIDSSPAFSPDGKRFGTKPGEAKPKIRLDFRIGYQTAAVCFSPCGNRVLPRAGSSTLFPIPQEKSAAFRTTSTNYSLEWLDMSRDGSSLATIETNRTSDLWFLPDGDSSKARQVTTGGSPVGFISSLGKDRFVLCNGRRPGLHHLQGWQQSVSARRGDRWL
jgi:WD40 repeat protein